MEMVVLHSHKQHFKLWEVLDIRRMCLVVVVLFTLGACANMTEELKKTLEPSSFDVIQDDNVRVTTEFETYQIDATELIIYVENLSERYSVIGAGTVPYYVEIELENEWYYVGPENDGPWAGFGISVRRGVKFPIDIDLEFIGFDWVKGHYRIVIPVSVISKNYYAAEFDMQ